MNKYKNQVIYFEHSDDGDKVYVSNMTPEGYKKMCAENLEQKDSDKVVVLELDEFLGYAANHIESKHSFALALSLQILPDIGSKDNRENMIKIMNINLSALNDETGIVDEIIASEEESA